MFRLLAITVFCLSFSGVAAAHGGDWGYGRHHHHHRHHHPRFWGYDRPYYPAYSQPYWGVRPIPPGYRELTPPRYYRYDRYGPDRDFDYRRGW